jgi:hypothetical protein
MGLGLWFAFGDWIVALSVQRIGPICGSADRIFFVWLNLPNLIALSSVTRALD